MTLLVIGVVAAVAGAAYFRYLATYRFWFPLPVGAGPAGPPVPGEPFRQAWTERPVMLLGLGDSITAGFGSSRGRSYFERLIANPPDEFTDMQGICLSAVLPNLVSRNLAVSGSNSLEHLNSQLKDIDPQGESVFGFVVVTTGGNDLIHWYGRETPKEGAMYGATLEQAGPWVKSFGKRLEEIVSRINRAFPGGCHIFIANIYDPSDGVGNPEAAGLPAWKDFPALLDAYNEEISKCAAAHDNVHLVDIQSAFMGHGVHCNQWWRESYHSNDATYWYAENLEDPNDRGYDAIRRLFLLEMINVAAAFRFEPVIVEGAPEP